MARLLPRCTFNSIRDLPEMQRCINMMPKVYDFQFYKRSSRIKVFNRFSYVFYPFNSIRDLLHLHHLTEASQQHPTFNSIRDLPLTPLYSTNFCNNLSIL